MFGEGSGNYARFIQMDNKILWSSKINNLKLDFKKEKGSVEQSLPSSSTFDELKELIESNNTKDVDDKLNEFYE